MADDRSLTRVLTWYKMTRWEYHLNKAAHTALITILFLAIGQPIWRAFDIAVTLYFSMPKLYYTISWWVWRPAASKRLRQLRNVFRIPYSPNPSDWLADLICCAAIAPFLVYHERGLPLAMIAFGIWLMGYVLWYPEANP